MGQLFLLLNMLTNIENITGSEFNDTLTGNSSGNVRIRALPPGKYPFMGEFHAATAQGVVIAE